MQPQLVSASVQLRHHLMNPGPYEYNGNRYLVLYRYGSPFEIGVWRSTNAGHTWTEADSANRKTPNAITIAGVTDTSTTIYVAYADATGLARVAEFSKSSNTWGTVTAGGPDIIAGLNGFARPGIGLGRRTNGDYVLVFSSCNGSGGNNETQYLVYSGGAWGATTLANTNGRLFGAVMDASDRFHVFSGWGVGSPDFTIKHKSLSNAGVLSSESGPTADMHLTVNPCWPVIWTPRGGSETVSVTFSRAIRWSFMTSSIASFQSNVGHISGATAVSPTFTTEDVGSGSPGGIYSANRYPFYALASLAGELYGVRIAPTTLREIYYSVKDSSGWSVNRRIFSAVGGLAGQYTVYPVAARGMQSNGRVGVVFDIANLAGTHQGTFYTEI